MLGSFVREKARALALFHEVAVIYIELGALGDKPGQVVSNQIEGTIRVVRIRAHRGHVRPRYLPAARDLRVGWRALTESGFAPDLIHAHVFTAGVGAALLGARHRLPVVVSENYTGFPRGTVRGLQRRLAAFAFSRADAVCPASEDLRRHIEALGITARFRVVPNAVDTQVFAPLDQPRPPGRALFVALLDEKKGMPHLLAALSRLRASGRYLALDVVGDGPRRGDYERLARDLGLADALIFHGIQEKAVVASMMQRASFLVLPSLWENLPNVLIEAMACGLPVLATEVGGVPELVDEQAGLLVPPGDPVALERGLLHMLNHHTEYGGPATVRRAHERYSLEAVGRQFEAVYAEALARHQGRPRRRRTSV